MAREIAKGPVSVIRLVPHSEDFIEDWDGI